MALVMETRSAVNGVKEVAALQADSAAVIQLIAEPVASPARA